jgi:hypothetical protein
MAALLAYVGGDFNRSANPVIASAATDVPSHCAINLARAGSGSLSEQCARGHDLPGLAIATLHYIDFEPCLLQSSANPRRTNVLDRLDLGIANVCDRQLAGALGGSVDVDRAGSAQSLAASILGANQAQLIAQHPEERHVARNVNLPSHAIDIESIRHNPSFSAFLESLLSHRSIFTPDRSSGIYF